MPEATEPASYSVDFDSGRADIRAAAMQILWGAGHSSVASQGVIRISGYTDATGSAAVNQALSDRRAEAVASQLVKMGLDRSRMVIAGYGAKADARRVDIVFEAAPAPTMAIVTFALGKAVISQQGAAILDGFIHGTSKAAAFQVSGYTDQTGTVAQNQRLSLRRAQAVAAYLIKAGIAPSQITAKGLGSLPGTTPANRRAEISVSP